jgi:hypothetical protein
LAEALEKAVQSGALSENLGNGLSTSQLAQAAAGGSLSAEQMAQLASAMGQSQRQIDQRLGQLANSRMLDPKLAAEIGQMCQAGQCAGGESPGEGQAGDLSDGPPANEGDPDQTARDGGAGRGGNSRGRGDAAMVWDNGADPTGVAFKEQALPPASLAGLRDSMTIGLGRADPTAEHSGVSGGGALSSSAGGPGSAYTHQVLPRHRATVGRYFQRQSQPPPPPE